MPGDRPSRTADALRRQGLELAGSAEELGQKLLAAMEEKRGAEEQDERADIEARNAEAQAQTASWEKKLRVRL